MKNIIAAIFALFIVFSCTTAANGIASVGKNQPSIAGTQWQLAEAPATGKTPTLLVERDRITGNAGCNSYFSTRFSMDTSAGRFAAGDLGATKMMCDNINVEQNFFEMLKLANYYVVNGEFLELYKDNLLLLRFKKM